MNRVFAFIALAAAGLLVGIGAWSYEDWKGTV